MSGITSKDGSVLFIPNWLLSFCTGDYVSGKLRIKWTVCNKKLLLSQRATHLPFSSLREGKEGNWKYFGQILHIKTPAVVTGEKLKHGFGVFSSSHKKNIDNVVIGIYLYIIN